MTSFIFILGCDSSGRILFYRGDAIIFRYAGLAAILFCWGGSVFILCYEICAAILNCGGGAVIYFSWGGVFWGCDGSVVNLFYLGRAVILGCDGCAFISFSWRGFLSVGGKDCVIILR